MGFGVGIVVDAHKQEVVGVLGYFCRVVLLLYLVDGGSDGLLVFQPNHHGWVIHIFAGDEHKVGYPLS